MNRVVFLKEAEGKIPFEEAVGEPEVIELTPSYPYAAIDSSGNWLEFETIDESRINSTATPGVDLVFLTWRSIASALQVALGQREHPEVPLEPHSLLPRHSRWRLLGA